MTNSLLQMCDIVDGFCYKCQQQVSNEFCPDMKEQVSKYNDDGEYDYEREDSHELDEDQLV